MTAPHTARYLVAPIATAACDDIHRDVVVLETDDLGTAQWVASHGPHLFGTAILDRVTGQLDVGYGFGVPCPALSDP